MPSTDLRAFYIWRNPVLPSFTHVSQILGNLMLGLLEGMQSL